MELILILLIVLILWPKPILGAVKWAIRYAFHRPPTPEAPASESEEGASPREP
jgi:hypothetical protein